MIVNEKKMLYSVKMRIFIRNFTSKVGNAIFRRKISNPKS